VSELDPSSYVNYYKRATVYLSLGKHSAALDDFDAILRLNPGFAQVSQSTDFCDIRADFDRRTGKKPRFWRKRGDSTRLRPN
jgi:DnaJ family protein C protein 3